MESTVKVWVVTGGIACGKSAVTHRLVGADEAAESFSSDEAVARAYSDPLVKQRVSELFGVQIGEEGITPENRRRIRDGITSSRELKRALEGILHPWVFSDMQRAAIEARTQGRKVLVAEVPLYYETGGAVAADCVIVVAASRATQLARLQKSRGLNEATSEDMLNLQLPIEAKTERADAVIWNDGSLQCMEKQVQVLRAQLISKLEDTHKMNDSLEKGPDTSAAASVGDVSAPAMKTEDTKAADQASLTETANSGVPSDSDSTTNTVKKAEEGGRSYPEELDIEEMQNMSPAALQSLAESVGWRINASRNKHQLIFDLMAWTGTKGTKFKVDGVLEMDAQGFGMIRYMRYSFKPMPEDIFVPSFLVRKFGLLAGQRILGYAKMPKEREKYAALDRIITIEGVPLEDWQIPTPFDKLTATFPSERIIMETKKEPSVTSRVIDLIAPLGKGQRGLIVASPRSGKTMVLKDIARSITTNHPEIHLIVLLLDERPEEVTDFEETVTGCDIFSSTFDESPKRHTQVAELVNERAKRLVEMKKDVVILLDSITRLARGYNALGGGKGRTMSGGMDAKAMSKPKKFFGAARNVEEGGSLTVIATALVETESKMDDLIFEEFKGTGNMEINLDREMAERRIYPAIHVTKSGTRRDDLLYHPDEFKRVGVIRRQLASVPAMEAMETLVKNMHRLKTNAELLMLGLR